MAPTLRSLFDEPLIPRERPFLLRGEEELDRRHPEARHRRIHGVVRGEELKRVEERRETSRDVRDSRDDPLPSPDLGEPLQREGRLRLGVAGCGELAFGRRRDDERDDVRSGDQRSGQDPIEFESGPS